MPRLSKGALREATLNNAIRPTVESDDMFANRRVLQGGNSDGTQALPTTDNRYRVNRSETLYLVQLIGSWVHVDEHAERVVKSRCNTRWVTFENVEYELRKEADFVNFLGHFLDRGCYAHIGGVTVHNRKGLRKVVAKPFIYITSTAALRMFRSLQTKTDN